MATESPSQSESRRLFYEKLDGQVSGLRQAAQSPPKNGTVHIFRTASVTGEDSGAAPWRWLVASTVAR
jgi:hypothetical protein